MNTRSLVFFDLDHTLVRANSSFRFGIFLFQQGKLPFFSMLTLVRHYYRHKRGKLSLAQLHKKIFHAFFCGQSKESLDESATQFWDIHYDALIDLEIEKIVEAIRTNGGTPIILSNSPDFLVKKFAQRSKIQTYHATPYAINDEGNFDSIPFIMDGPKKAHMVQQLARENNIPIEHTLGYSDSIHDLAFLESVGTPIATHPDPALRSIAEKNGWQIIN